MALLFLRHFRALLAAGTALCLVATGAAAAGPRGAGPEPVSEGAVQSIVDGDTLVLETGTQVRLVGIQAPKLPLGRRNFPTWPLADAAKAALAELAAGRTLTLRYDGRKVDRHGRLLAHLFAADGTWIQGALLRRGMARVYSFPDNRSRVDEMLAAERAARAAKRGIWADPFYAVRTPDQARRHIGTFQLVEGTVAGAAVVRGRAYLNFGENWKTDFTVAIPPRALRRFWKNGPAVESYRGKRLRVRGWLRSYNGPLIEATHPEQIEVLR